MSFNFDIVGADGDVVHVNVNTSVYVSVYSTLVVTVTETTVFNADRTIKLMRSKSKAYLGEGYVDEDIEKLSKIVQRNTMAGVNGAIGVFSAR